MSLLEKKKKSRNCCELVEIESIRLFGVDLKRNKSFRHRKQIMCKTGRLVPFNEALMTPMLLVCCFKSNQVAQSWDVCLGMAKTLQ